MGHKFCFKTLQIIALALVLYVQGILALGKISCERLDEATCAFAVSFSGERCVMEKKLRRSGGEAFICTKSEINADRINNWIESDKCVLACGLDRKTLGISSDALLDPLFRQRLCSSQCYAHCPNIVDLFFNLAAAEGVFLPTLCEAEGEDRRREMSEIKGGHPAFAAQAPLQFVEQATVAASPSPAPATVID